MNEEDILTGCLFRGILLGMKSEPWKKDPTKFNHLIALRTKSPDGFGGFNSETKMLNISQSDFPKFQELSTKSSGQLIEVPLVYSMRTFGDNTFLNEYIPADAVVKIIPVSVPKLSKTA